MKERPILFKGEMVRAILEGRKTQTRRLEGLDGINAAPDDWEFHRVQDGYPDGRERFVFYPKGDGEPVGIVCPKGQTGDRLWVKETFCCVHGIPHAEGPQREDFVRYRADADDAAKVLSGHQCWKPSIFMPRVYSRITLEITGVRVERLNEISAADADAEGVRHLLEAGFVYRHGPRDDYRTLWESFNGKGSWAANPWVWVIEFRKIDQPAL